MIISASHNNDHLLHWVAAALLLTGFAIGDTAIIAWCASLANLWQLAAAALSYVLIAVDILFTVWQMSEISNRLTRHL